MTKLSKKTVKKPWTKENWNKKPDVMDFEPLTQATEIWANKLTELSGWYKHKKLCKILSKETARPFTWRERKTLKKYVKESDLNIEIKSRRPKRKSNTSYYIGQPIKKRIKEAKKKVDDKYNNIIEKAFKVGRKPSVCIATIKYLTGNNELQKIAKDYSVSGAAIRNAKDFVNESLND